MKPTLFDSRRQTAAIILAGFFATFPSALVTAQPIDRSNDIPWRQDYYRRSGDLGPGRAGHSVEEERKRQIRRRDQRIARQSDRLETRVQRDQLPNEDPQGRATAPDTPWWSSEAEADSNFQRSGERQPQRGEIDRASQIVAVVGDKPILAGDLLGRVNEMLARFAGQVPKEELDKKRWELVQQSLPTAVESKLVYLDFLRNVKPEQLDAVRDNVFKQFDEKQLPALMEKANVKDIAELDAKMRAVGGSLEKTRRMFFEQVAAREMIRKHSEKVPEFTPVQLLRKYREQKTVYKIDAQAKWEQLTVAVGSYASADERRAAYAKLSKMGNAVLRGARFDVVAKKDSDGPTADSGGAHDWTIQGSLVSTVLDEAIFTLEVGRLSSILMDDVGFHIIRVVERKDSGHVPFTTAQTEIREAMEREHKEDLVKTYIERLKKETYVWNMFVAQKESDTRRY